MPYCYQVLKVEVKADTEHHQDNPDLRKLTRHTAVCHKAGCIRPDDKPRQQVSDNRRKTQALCNKSQRQCRRETVGQSQEKSGFMHDVEPTRYPRFTDNTGNNFSEGLLKSHLPKGKVDARSEVDS